jgi:hypothetical protein
MLTLTIGFKMGNVNKIVVGNSNVSSVNKYLPYYKMP